MIDVRKFRDNLVNRIDEILEQTQYVHSITFIISADDDGDPTIGYDVTEALPDLEEGY